MSVSSFSSAAKPGVCLSTDRPDSPFDGQVIYETDTNRTLVYDNSAWVVIHDPALMSYSGTGVTVTADAATIGGENVTPYTGRRNLLYNGAFQVAQRSTSVTGITGSSYNTADRWRTSLGGLGTWTQSVENDAPTGSGFSKSLKMLCTAADAAPAATDYCYIQERLEGQDLQRIKKGASSAEQLTVSFWVKANVTGTHIVELEDSDNSRSVSASYTVVASGTWEFKTVTFPADTTGVLDDDNAYSMALNFWVGAGSNYTSGSLATTWGARTSANRAVGQTNVAAATDNYWQITGVQLETGPVATPFEHLPYGDELLRCCRYFEQVNTLTNQGANAVGGAINTTTIRGAFQTKTIMRSAPTLEYSTTPRPQGNGLSLTPSAWSTGLYGTTATWQATVSGASTAHVYHLYTGSGGFTLSAEL